MERVRRAHHRRPVERGGLLGRLTYQWTPNTTFFLDAGFTRNQVDFQANPPA
jgi:hypothetical protein